MRLNEVSTPALRAALLASACALSAWAPTGSVSAQLRPTIINDIVNGGLATDGWAGISTETTLTRGSIQLALPDNATVTEAVLISLVYMERTEPDPARVTPGPVGNPRVVILGGGAVPAMRTLEGPGDFTLPPVGFAGAYHTFITDVSATVAGIVGTTVSDGVVSVPIAERGDTAADSYLGVHILGHTLLVEYTRPGAPRRQIIVYGGLVQTGVAPQTIALVEPLSNLCGSTAEPFAAALGMGWELDTEQESSFVINGSVLTRFAGGSDECATNELSCLYTSGSFGGTGNGAAVAVDMDSLTGPGTGRPGRLDDELYDFRALVPDGTTSLTFELLGSADEAVTFIALQFLSADAVGDADGDGVRDADEGALMAICPDADRDGTPDYLDTDSDNDCAPDGRDPARTDASRPNAIADLNCSDANACSADTCDTSAGTCSFVPAASGTACPGGVCDGSAGFACVACLDRGTGTDPGCRDAAPICVDAGGRPACVACVDRGAGTDEGCGPTAPVCAPDGGGMVSCLVCVDSAMGAGIDDGCAAGAAYCVPGGTGPSCVECVTGADCRSGTVCSPAGACVPGCDEESDCMAPTPHCDLMAGACVECTTDAQCGVGFRCEPMTRTCVPTAVCMDAVPGGGVDPGCDATSPICVGMGMTAMCVRCFDSGSMTDDGCAVGTPVCTDLGAGSLCVECVGPADCDPGTLCGPANTCVTGCDMDADCSGATPRCALARGACVECIDMADCEADERCDTATNTCIAMGTDVGVRVDAGGRDAGGRDGGGADGGAAMDAGPTGPGITGGACACRVGHAPFGWLGLALFGVMLAYRRRR